MAGLFHFQPSEMEAMDADDFAFYLERAREYGKWRQQAQAEDPFRSA
jgi:hypothetical protein